MRVDVVVVAYNSRDYLGECLAALEADRASPPFEVWVVDNASTDGSVDLAEAQAARSPRFHVLRNVANRGYAGGVNSALPHGQGEFVAVLNPDCVVEPGCLTAPARFLNTHPQAGAVSPLLMLDSGQSLSPGPTISPFGVDGEQRQDARINAAGQDVHVTGLGFNRWLWRPRAQAGAEPAPVSGLHGAAFVIRRGLLEQMGGWEEGGFLYHEDVELSWLLQLMGYDLYCMPTSVVRHHYHLTMYPEKLFLLERNRWAMLITHLRPMARWGLAPFLVFTEALMWGYCLLRGPGFLKAKAASYRWVAEQGDHLRERQRRVESLRQRSDFEVLRRLRWNYAWDQLFSLGRERGESRRKPAGGMPVELE